MLYHSCSFLFCFRCTDCFGWITENGKNIALVMPMENYLNTPDRGFSLTFWLNDYSITWKNSTSFPVSYGEESLVICFSEMVGAPLHEVNGASWLFTPLAGSPSDGTSQTSSVSFTSLIATEAPRDISFVGVSWTVNNDRNRNSVLDPGTSFTFAH